MTSSYKQFNFANIPTVNSQSSWIMSAKLIIVILVFSNSIGPTVGVNLGQGQGGVDSKTRELATKGHDPDQLSSTDNTERNETIQIIEVRPAGPSYGESVVGSQADHGNESLGQGHTSYSHGSGIGVTESGSAGHGNGSSGHGNNSVDHGSGPVDHGSGLVDHGSGSVDHGNGSEGHGDGSQGHGNGSEGHGEIQRFKVAKLDFGYVKTYFMVSIFVLFACLAKIFFHLEKHISKYVPESCLLILLGIIVGGVLYVCDEKGYELNITTFFLILLPPIILDAGYFMPARPFFDNLGTILLYAILGTLFNTLCLGFSLWGIYEGGGFKRLDSPLLLLDSLVFTSLLAAVDPVAVLAVFESVHVNEILYIVVFGESLLNDGISVVLYHLFEGLSEIGAANILPIDVIAGVGSFFVIVFGAVGIGILLGLFAGVISRFTRHVRVMEPLIVFVIGYLAFIIAEMFHLSGILACTFCGITMRKYVEVNFSTKSQTTIRYLLKMIATVCEIIIFMYLGISAVSDTHTWDTAFVLITLLLCLVIRALGVLLLTFFANMIRVVKLSYIDQFVMSYGGLRGAIAFALVVLLDPHHFKHRRLFITSTVVVIYFTNLILGTTIEPLVNLLKVKKAVTRDLAVAEKIVYRCIDHVMAGMEDIADQKGHHLLRERFSHFNNAFLKKVIAGKKNPQKRGFHIMSTYSEANERDMTRALQSSPSLTTLFRSLSQVDLTNLTRASSIGQLARSPYSLVNLQAAASSAVTGHLERNDSYGDGSLSSKSSDQFHQSDSAVNLVQIDPTNKKSRDISKGNQQPMINGSPQVSHRPKGRYIPHSANANSYINIPSTNVYTVQASDSSNGSPGSTLDLSGQGTNTISGSGAPGYSEGKRYSVTKSSNEPDSKLPVIDSSSRNTGAIIDGRGRTDNDSPVGGVISFVAHKPESGRISVSADGEGSAQDKEKAKQIVDRLTDALIKTQNESGISNPAFDDRSDDNDFSDDDDDDEKEVDQGLAEQRGLRQRGVAGGVTGGGAGGRGYTITATGDVIVRPRPSVSGDPHHLGLGPQTPARQGLDVSSRIPTIVLVSDEMGRNVPMVSGSAPGSPGSAPGSPTGVTHQHSVGTGAAINQTQAEQEGTARGRGGFYVDRF